MDELAKESEYTKRTIYRYFTCKEDLFYAVALQGNQRLYEMVVSESSKGSTGYEKIRHAYYAYYQFYRTYPKLLQLINTGELIKSQLSDANVPYRQRFIEFDGQLFSTLTKLFAEGGADGSLRTDLDISQLALSSIFTAAGFFQMLSVSGSGYTTHFGLDEETFIAFSINRFTDSLRSR